MFGQTLRSLVTDGAEVAKRSHPVQRAPYNFASLGAVGQVDVVCARPGRQQFEQDIEGRLSGSAALRRWFAPTTVPFIAS